MTFYKSSVVMLRVLFFVILLLLFACGGGGSGSSTVSSSGTGAIAFSVAWEAPATERHAAGLVQTLAATELDCQDVGVTTVEAKVYDENGTLLSTGGPWPCDQHSGTIENVAVGHHIKVVILGQNGDGLMYRGEAASITVTDGGTTEIEEPIAAINFVPSNLTPVDNTSFTATESGQASVIFDCSSTPGASTYHFLLASDPNFASIEKDEPVVFPLTVSLNPGTYYWKVSCADQHGNQGTWSETLSFTVTGAVVSFQDPNLEAAVREALNKPDGELTTDELQTVTTLSAYSRNITNLNGIQNLTQLDFLDLDSNQISDISPLQNLTQLTYLYLSENKISNITPLQNLTILSNLFLYGNQISNISILQNLTQLTWLFLSDNQISDISPLQNLTQLTNLGLSQNQISDITALQNLTQLVELFLSINQISDISPLQNLTQLTNLRLSDNQITDISLLENLTQLTVLRLDSNQISDISPLQNLTQLVNLYIGINQISTINPLQGITKLTALDMTNNQISDISPLQNLTQLVWLYSGNNQISDIGPLQNLTQLKQLWLNRNQISDVSPLQNLNQLIDLSLGDNCIADFSPIDHVANVYGKDNQGNCTLEVAEFEDANLEAAVREALNKPDGDLTLDDLETITTLDASSKNITNLNGIENLTELTDLNLGYNQISDISILQNLTQLTSLNLDSNQINDISILQNLLQLTSLSLARSQNSDITPIQNLLPQLTSLNLSYNRIDDISFLQSASQLTDLNLGWNQLNDISILQNLTQLTTLSLYHNQIRNFMPIQNLTQLTTLNLGYNQISDISILQNLPQLTTLSLPGNQISDISLLQNFIQLTMLWLSDNCITDFSPVNNVISVFGQDDQGDCSTVTRIDSTTGGEIFDTAIDGIVEIIYDAQPDSTMDSRDVLNNWDAENYQIDLSALPLGNGVDVNGNNRDDNLDAIIAQTPISFDGASSIPDFFLDTINDVDGVAGIDMVDRAIVVQHEAGTPNYRIFIDHNGDGNFISTDDMVIDITNEIVGGFDNVTGFSTEDFIVTHKVVKETMYADKVLSIRRGDIPSGNFQGYYGGNSSEENPRILTVSEAENAVIGAPDGEFLSLPGYADTQFETGFSYTTVEVGFEDTFGYDANLIITEIENNNEAVQLWIWFENGGNIQPEIIRNTDDDIVIDLSQYAGFMENSGLFTKVTIGGLDTFGPSQGFDLDAVAVRYGQ
jgi:internalin A